MATRSDKGEAVRRGGPALEAGYQLLLWLILSTYGQIPEVLSSG